MILMKHSLGSKQCSKCEQIKNHIYFNKRSASPDGFTPSCKECNKQYLKSKRDRNKEANKNRIVYKSKKCSHCDIKREAKFFYKKTSAHDGLSYYCKPCSYNKDQIIIAKNKAKNLDRVIYNPQICIGCDIFKPSDDYFKNNSSKSGLHSKCKQCVLDWKKKRLENLNPALGQACKTCNKYKDASNFWLAIPTKTNLYPDCINCCKIKASNYRPRRRELKKQRYRNDPIFRLSSNIQSVISKSITNSFIPKRGLNLQKRVLDYLPYTIDELKNHIESLWKPWMNWKNYGKYNKAHNTWQIDHIFPQSKLPYNSMDDLNFLKCWSLSNLRPLETIANIKKGNRVS